MTIGFLHTAAVHRDTFTGLLNEVSPGRASTHVVDEALLSDARQRGGVDDELMGRLRFRLQQAARGATVVICTCSTISGPAETLSDQLGVPVVRIDRPMAERAVAAGPRIAVVAALQSTVAPTVGLIREIAAQRGLTATVDDVVLPEAWSLFENGDLVGYAEVIAAGVDAIDPRPDVVVLSQASMAAAVPRCAITVPVLSSPRSAVEAAVALA